MIQIYIYDICMKHTYVHGNKCITRYICVKHIPFYHGKIHVCYNCCMYNRVEILTLLYMCIINVSIHGKMIYVSYICTW